MHVAHPLPNRRLPRFIATTAFAVALIAGPSMTVMVRAASSAASTDPASLVNVFIGTGNGGKVAGKVNTFPGAAMPFGMLTWSPATTPTRTEGGGYFYKDTHISGFSLTHLSGPGCPSAGEVPILPIVGKVGAPPGVASTPFDHAHEHATPGKYQVTLSPGTPSAIAVKLATTTRTGIGTFRFPTSHKAGFLFKVSDAQARTTTSTVNVVGNDTLQGSETSGHFCDTAGAVTLYFVAKFNRPFHAYGTWTAGAPKIGVRTATGAHTGAWVSFDTTNQRTVELKVAISYVSVADAWANLRAEQHGWHFTAVADKAHRAWNRLLSRIEVSGGTHNERVKFYTALYHVLLAPSVFSDASGRYAGFGNIIYSNNGGHYIDSSNNIHTLAKGQKNQYANFSGWDIYRSQIPLLALLVPDRVGDMMTSLLNDQAQGGWLPKWGYGNVYTGIMNGDSADPILAGAYAFGVRNFDAHTALKAMVYGATYVPTSNANVALSGGYVERPGLQAYEKLGFVPGNASETLEYAVDDFAISRFAHALGSVSTEKRFAGRANNWRNLFDRHAEFRKFKGYIEPRARDGKFRAGPAFQGDDSSGGHAAFEEGNAVQYTWMVPQNIAGLVAAMGGDKNATARLDLLFTHLNVGSSEPYYWAGNEMCIGIPWLYNYVGAPWKTQAIVHRLIQSVYANAPGGEPGNDDLGAMSSWLVWADLGMYPETPGAPVVVLGAPVFPNVTMHLGNGHVVTIQADNADLHHYVRGLRVNGRTWTKSWLPASLLYGARQSGHETRLVFDLGTQPSPSWGVAKANRPPSWGP